MNCTDGHTFVNLTVAFMLTWTYKSHTLIYVLPYKGLAVGMYSNLWKILDVEKQSFVTFWGLQLVTFCT